MTLGECIREYREEHSMTMEAFAEKAGVTKAYISMLEKGNANRGGKRPAPSLRTYKGCAVAMGMDVDSLIRLVDDVISVAPPETEDISELELALLAAWRSASEREREDVAHALRDQGFSYQPPIPLEKAG